VCCSSWSCLLLVLYSLVGGPSQSCPPHSVFHQRQQSPYYSTHTFKENLHLGSAPAYTQQDRGKGSRLYKVNILMWHYGRGRPQMVSIAEVEMIRRSISARAGSGQERLGSDAARLLLLQELPRVMAEHIELLVMISYVISFHSFLSLPSPPLHSQLFCSSHSLFLYPPTPPPSHLPEPVIDARRGPFTPFLPQQSQPPSPHPAPPSPYLLWP
jgi:hypothetical protein